uniref:Uncharacterized protein n=1 Tax=Phytophthora fragariae TaxID=53985 RepID=A0A6A3DDA5_9STRA|nr:hypothetical protein PF009_g31425 [Phytophthora fragariae]
MWRRKQHGRDGEATVTILKSYDAFEALLVEAQLADSMLVALATPWRLTPPIDVATQAARSRQGGDGDNFEVHGRDGEATVTILMSYDAFKALLV